MGLNSEKLKEIAENYAAAWSSKSPEAVASYYADDGQISINRGDTSKGRGAIVEMAAGFYSEFPDLVVHCDDVRASGTHAIFVWTLEGHHSETKNFVRVGGWEEWELDADMKVKSSLGWFDAEDYERQIREGVQTDA
jgi:uncharacterized protein (TIGR02246 family)